MPTMRTNNSSVNLTIEQILNGTVMGRTQSVGHMEIIPLMPGSADAVDESFGPPNLSIDTNGYGHVRATNPDPDHPTIIPLGAGWVSDQAAQDHAIGSAEFVKPKETKAIDTAMCIQRSQGGYLSKVTDMLILPAPLRVQALAMRKQTDIGRLWNSIYQFNQDLGIQEYDAQVVYFLKHFAKQLDEFVAEFELLDGQIGAIILVGGKVVGIERGPNPAYWATLWNPLIRICYGALALKARQVLGDRPSPTRTPLDVKEKSLAGIRAALQSARQSSQIMIDSEIGQVKQLPLLASDKDRTFQDYSLLTVANSRLAGQMIEKKDGHVTYVSIGAAAVR